MLAAEAARCRFDNHSISRSLGSLSIIRLQALMAGIVASTLRRRTIRHKASIDARIQADQAAASSASAGAGGGGSSLPMQTLSPSAAVTSGPGPPSRSASFRRSFTDRSPCRQPRVYAPKGAKLFHEDFWPNCINANEPNLRLVTFDSFE